MVELCFLANLVASVLGFDVAKGEAALVGTSGDVGESGQCAL